MGNLSIAGTDIPDFHQAFPAVGVPTPADGIYYALGDLGDPPYEGPPMHQELEISFPGVNGVGIKRMGFRGRMIKCKLLIVGLTKDGCEAQKNVFFTAITPLPSFSITVPGGVARPACRIVGGAGSAGQWLQMGGKLVMAFELEFKSIRE